MAQNWRKSSLETWRHVGRDAVLARLIDRVDVLPPRDEPELREYSREQIAEFLRADELDTEARAIAQRFAEATALPQRE